MPTPIDSTEVKLQTDCKRAAHDEPSGGITRRHRGQSEEVRQGIILHRPTPTLRTLGKLITQRSQVQILSTQRAEAAGQRPAAFSQEHEVGLIRPKLQTNRERGERWPWRGARLGGSAK